MAPLAPALALTLASLTQGWGDDDGAVAPAGTWYTTHGTAARTSIAARTPSARIFERLEAREVRYSALHGLPMPGTTTWSRSSTG